MTKGKQIITIGLGGEVSGLQRKPGQGVNLQSFGHAQTERVSEIVWDEGAQAWTVVPIRGPFAGCVLTAGLWLKHVGPFSPEGVRGLTLSGGDVFYFEDYDLAVKAEIAFLDAARVEGVF